MTDDLKVAAAYIKLVKAVNRCSQEVQEEVLGKLDEDDLDDSLQV